MKHSDAKKIVDFLPVSQGESLLIRAIAWLETGYGSGWRGEGAASNNVGAITAGPEWTGETFEHVDSRYDASSGRVVEYTTHFRVYDTIEGGFQDLYDVLRRSYPRALELADAGRWSEVSGALYGYYLGTVPRDDAIAQHRVRLYQALRTISDATGEPFAWDGDPPTMPPSKSKFNVIAVAIGIAALPLALAIMKTKKVS